MTNNCTVNVCNTVLRIDVICFISKFHHYFELKNLFWLFFPFFRMSEEIYLRSSSFRCSLMLQVAL